MTDDADGLTQTDPTSGTNRGQQSARRENHLSLYRAQLDLDDVGKYGAIAALVCYVVGLVTVNAYLFQLGASDFTVLRTRFILTGFIVFLSIFILFFVVKSFAVSISYARGRSSSQVRGNRRLGNVERWLPLMLLVSICLLIFSWLLLEATSRPMTLDASIIDAAVVLLTIDSPIIYVLSRSEQKHKIDFAQTGFDWFLESITGILALGAFLIYISFFATFVYPSIPQQFGGGRPQEVRLIVSNDVGTLFGARGLDILESEFVSKPLDLLWETDTMYIVRIADDVEANVLHVDKDSVTAVIGEPQFADLGDDDPADATPVGGP
jgi:hypothetical protein